MPSSSASTATLYNEQMSFHHEPAATEAANGSPKSLASGLSSASSTSSSSTASAEARHKRRLAQSKYHDIDYLKTLANAGLTDGSVNVLSGKQVGEFVGLLSKDPTLRNRTGPVVVARSAVTGGRKIVDYARMWRGDTKAHRNKGPRKDFLEEEFDSARDAQSVIKQALYATVPEDQAVQHDEELKRAVKEFDKAFRRQSVIEAMPQSGSAANPAEPKPTTLHKKKSSRHDSTSDAPRQSSNDTSKDKALPLPPAAAPVSPQRPKMSATASVQSIPYLGPLNGSPKAHERLKVANPDSRASTVASVEDLLESSSKKNRRDLLILLLDDADEEWNMKHPTPAMRRMPTARKSRWDGKLAPPKDTRRSHSYDDQRQEGAQHQPIHMPPGDITPPRWSSTTIPSTGSSPMGPPLEMPGTVFQSQATGTVGYSPGSIYAPPGQGGVLPQYLPTPSMASTMYTPSMASSAYTMSPASTSSSYLMSPPSAAYNGVALYPSSTATFSPPGMHPMAMGASPYAISQPALSPYTTAVPLQYHY